MALIVSRVKCLYQRDEDGHCSPKCGCMSAPLEDHHEILVDKQEIQGVEVLILSKNKHDTRERECLGKSLVADQA